MVLIPRIILFFTLIYSSFVYCSSNINSTNLRRLFKQHQYLKIIKIIDNDFTKKSINLKLLLSDSDVAASEKIQIELYFKLKSLLAAIKKGDLKFSTENINYIKKVLEISDDFELDSDDYDFDDLLESFEKASDRWAQSQFKLKYFVSLSYLTWNYPLILTSSNGSKDLLTSKERGPCIGGGARYSNSRWGVESGLCYGYISATVANLKYNQNNVPVDTLISTTSILWKPKDRVAIKLGLPVIYHNGKYQSASGGSITDSNQLSYGYLIANEWTFLNMSFEISYGDIRSYPSSFWSFKLNYFLK